jgi:hypothetical protein
LATPAADGADNLKRMRCRNIRDEWDRIINVMEKYAMAIFAIMMACHRSPPSAIR